LPRPCLSPCGCASQPSAVGWPPQQPDPRRAAGSGPFGQGPKWGDGPKVRQPAARRATYGEGNKRAARWEELWGRKDAKLDRGLADVACANTARVQGRWHRLSKHGAVPGYQGHNPCCQLPHYIANPPSIAQASPGGEGRPAALCGSLRSTIMMMSADHHEPPLDHLDLIPGLAG